MENTSETTHIINPYVSVDCVLFGYDGENLNVLLVKQTGTAQDLAPHSHEESTETNPEDSDKESTMKLPGSLIYNDEDLDQAAQRVLLELTGLHNIPMHQFHSFGSKDRTNNPRDTKWLQRFHQLNSRIERIVTIGYFTVLKMSPRIRTLSHRYEACWVPLNSVGNLAFDHNRIIKTRHGISVHLHRKQSRHAVRSVAAQVYSQRITASVRDLLQKRIRRAQLP